MTAAVSMPGIPARAARSALGRSLPRWLRCRLGGPGTLYHASNALVLLVASAVFLHAQNASWTLGAFTRHLIRGEPGAAILSIGALLFFLGAEAYHRGSAEGHRGAIQLGDAATALGSLAYASSLMIYGGSAFAAASGCLLFLIKAMLASAPFFLGGGLAPRSESAFRRACVIVRLPAIACLIVLLSRRLTAGTWDASTLVLAALLSSYLMCALADFLLSRHAAN